MYWIGITGGMGTGKSSFAKFLMGLGYVVLDADILGHQILQKGEVSYSLIVKAFGPSVLDSEQNIDRRQLANIAFSSTENLRKLEDISHPAIRKRVRSEKQKLIDEGVLVAFYDIPLLFEKKLQKEFDKTVMVWCDSELQLLRIKKRNPDWTDADVLQRLSKQLSMDEKKKLADVCIENNSSLEDLEQRAINFVKTLSCLYEQG